MSSSDSDLHDIVSLYFRRTLGKQSLRDDLPLPAYALSEDDIPEQELPSVAAIATNARTWTLASDADWSLFSRSFTTGKKGNLLPWFRSIGVLRGLRACSAILEPHYVCLDYRSEFAAFYSHLDKPRRHATKRLHFFSEPVNPRDIVRLSDPQVSSYLGYIVCRQADMPLVGRSLIKTPKYIDVQTGITEPVHFFGQELPVTGVPFMQQDERLAVCANVAVWIAHYCGYRRGLFERRFIADFVRPGRTSAMRSRMPQGLSGPSTSALLDEAGFRSWSFDTPLMGSSSFPKVTADELPVLAAAMKIKPPDFDKLSDTVFLQYGAAISTQKWKRDDDRIRHLDDVIDYLLYPYISSGWPICAGTQDHVMTLCGRSRRNERTSWFLHDDQIGPYLLADSFGALSLDFMRKQSGRYEDFKSRVHAAVPPSDSLANEITFPTSDDFPDNKRSICSFIVPLPPRVLLPASVACHDARIMIKSLFSNEILKLVGDEMIRTALSEDRLSVTLVEGIEFKSRRRRYAYDQRDQLAALAYSSVHLSEWTLLVQAHVADGRSLWEVVYDASSGDDVPRIQFIRMLNSFFVVKPGLRESFEVERGQIELYPAFTYNPGDRVAKTRIP